jgi:hypothetical protein
MKITKKQIGRPCDIELKNGVTAHGRIENVRRGIVSIREMYIPDVHTSDNGNYTGYYETKDNQITVY